MTSWNNCVSFAFDTRWRGLDPTQVYDYLARVADELDRLHRDLAAAATIEADRIRLRRWLVRRRATGAPIGRWPR